MTLAYPKCFGKIQNTIMKKKKNDKVFTTQEMIDRLQKHGLKGDDVTWKDALTMLAFTGLVILVAIVLMALAGCKTNPPMDYEWEVIPQQPFISADYRYYVIDSHSDVPDAKFETLEEASVYQKEFAEYHDYVIVKIKDKYNVYNMELTE